MSRPDSNGGPCLQLTTSKDSTMLTVTIDASKLTKWAGDLSARGMRNAIRRAVDKSATAARKIALENISKDIGVPKARIKNAVSKVRRTTLTNLSASFTASKMRISILPTGASVTRPGGLTGSTFRLTGGCSASLNVKEAFIVNANGGRFVAVRRSKSRLPIKAAMQRCRARPSDRAALPRKSRGRKPPTAN